MTVPINDVLTLHEFVVADKHIMAIYSGANSVSADLFNVTNPASVKCFAVSINKASANRMRRSTLCKSGILKQFLLLEPVVMNSAYLEATFGKRTSLVKNNSCYL